MDRGRLRKRHGRLRGRPGLLHPQGGPPRNARLLMGDSIDPMGADATSGPPDLLLRGARRSSWCLRRRRVSGTTRARDASGGAGTCARASGPPGATRMQATPVLCNSFPYCRLHPEASGLGQAPGGADKVTRRCEDACSATNAWADCAQESDFTTGVRTTYLQDLRGGPSRAEVSARARAVARSWWQ